MTNRLRALHAEGTTAIGGWCATPSTFNAEVLGAEGFDYVCVDCQHGLIDYDQMWPMVQALRFCQATPIVRLPFNDTPWFGKALDAGALGVVVPMVNSRAEAEQAAAACRYPPEGVRSYGPVRASMLLGPDPATVNREVLCLVMIETVRAVEDADAICSTPGVDGVYIGPADLAISMGLAVGEMFVAEAHLAAVEHVRSICATHGIIAGIHTQSGLQARQMGEAGFDMCTIATDAVFLRQAAKAELQAARHGAASPGQGGIYG